MSHKIRVLLSPACAWSLLYHSYSIILSSMPWTRFSSRLNNLFSASKSRIPYATLVISRRICELLDHLAERFPGTSTQHFMSTSSVMARGQWPATECAANCSSLHLAAIRLMQKGCNYTRETVSKHDSNV